MSAAAALPFWPDLAAQAPPVEARDLWFSYRGGREVLRGVDLTVDPGRITMVVGASGGGKTTLLKLIKGLAAPRRGSVRVFGRPVRPAPFRGRLDREVAFIPQHLGLVRNTTVLDNVLTGALGRTGLLPSLLKLFPKGTVRQAHETLGMLGIGHKADDLVYTLSGGERQRVAIARALMQQPRLILADEFISQLDANTSREIMDAMRRIVDGGLTLLMTTHELDVVRTHADRVLVLRDGRKVLDTAAAGLARTDLTAAMAS